MYNEQILTFSILSSSIFDISDLLLKTSVWRYVAPKAILKLKIYKIWIINSFETYILML